MIESDRHWATMSEAPEDIIRSLYRRMGGARSMPKLSIELLEEATRVCPELMSAYEVESI